MKAHLLALCLLAFMADIKSCTVKRRTNRCDKRPSKEANMLNAAPVAAVFMTILFSWEEIKSASALGSLSTLTYYD